MEIEEGETHSSTFGQQFRALRIREGLTQNEAARLLRTHPTTLNKVEIGKRLPPRKWLIAERFNMIPGFSEHDIDLLVSSMLPVKGISTHLPRVTLSPVDGVDIHIFHDPNKIDGDLLELIKTEVSFSVKSVMERALGKRAYLDKYFSSTEENNK